MAHHYGARYDGRPIRRAACPCGTESSTRDAAAAVVLCEPCRLDVARELMRRTRGVDGTAARNRFWADGQAVSRLWGEVKGRAVA